MIVGAVAVADRKARGSRERENDDDPVGEPNASVDRNPGSMMPVMKQTKTENWTSGSHQRRRPRTRR